MKQLQIHIYRSPCCVTLEKVTDEHGDEVFKADQIYSLPTGAHTLVLNLPEKWREPPTERGE